jgi:hypothetical protein
MGIFVGGGITLGAGVTLTSPIPPVPGSIEFVDGTTDALTLPAVLDLTDTNTFTLEAWIYPTAYNSTTVLIGDISGGTTDWHLSIQSDVLVFYWTDGIDGFTSTGDTTINENEWTHIALSVSSSYIRMFVNGATQDVTGELFFTNTATTTNQLVIGNQLFDASDAFLGYMTNIRINNTTSLYNDSFIPQIPLIDVAGTVLLLLANDTSPFIDSSSAATTVTNLGSVAYSPLYP